MRKLFVVAVLLAGAVALAEVAAPEIVAAQVEAAITSETHDRLVVEADVSGPPLLLPVLFTARVASLDLHVREVTGRLIPVDVHLGFTGVEVDRPALLRGDVVVTDVERATATVRADLSGAMPAALQPFVDRLGEVGLERLLAAVGGGIVSASAGALAVGGTEIPVASCQSQAQDLIVTTTCELDQIPSFVVRSLQRG